eukprot:TRINITY_DN59559_c0_g1_i1.p1 TRINITY_DN59559_c0_g1~~TRINITY_DN59559_c0_g1_i1.p1  ORF type:complete len:339 (+),score=27.48 TRINITY_DN59559_c0_g1_i1:492-1508(+)
MASVLLVTATGNLIYRCDPGEVSVAELEDIVEGFPQLWPSSRRARPVFFVQDYPLEEDEVIGSMIMEKDVQVVVEWTRRGRSSTRSSRSEPELVVEEDDMVRIDLPERDGDFEDDDEGALSDAVRDCRDQADYSVAGDLGPIGVCCSILVMLMIAAMEVAFCAGLLWPAWWLATHHLRFPTLSTWVMYAFVRPCLSLGFLCFGTHARRLCFLPEGHPTSTKERNPAALCSVSCCICVPCIGLMSVVVYWFLIDGNFPMVVFYICVVSQALEWLFSRRCALHYDGISCVRIWRSICRGYCMGYEAETSHCDDGIPHQGFGKPTGLPRRSRSDGRPRPKE